MAAIVYPPELPISQRRDELLAAIEANQVVVVAGETGSGKSTQLPKLCLELGRGTAGLIGHTQPRRLAARTIAERVAEELDTRVGDLVGYTVRFNDQVGPSTRLKVMTDGILLAEIPRDRQLRRYDTIIIDEAHERSLNIDFIIGYLRNLLPRRPDLKLIITSATIDTERFSRHFGHAPVIEVSGRTYPVELRYQPLDDPHHDEPLDQNDGIKHAVGQLWHDSDGDILVFCSGEREIRDAAEAVAELKLLGSEVIPLYARLSAAEQHRVFQAHAKRRVVIATNVAETSLTVPGIRAVIDVGTARISRYSNRTKVQRLPIEDISQASANQRAGRCGRLGPGICIRLYSEPSFEARPLFTEPEITRTNLASVILQMAALGLGKVEDFPFLDPPDSRSIRDGIELLTELDAINPGQEHSRQWLTPTGRQLARLPVDPRFGRMLLEADHNGCLDEVMIIVAGLSVEDPRERPSDAQPLADDSHRRFADPRSDFLSYVNLWDHVAAARRERSQGQFRRLCRREYLNYNRLVEWQDIHTQLRQVARELKLQPARRRPGQERKLEDKAHRDAIHTSILAGLLSQLGVKDKPDDRADNKASRRGNDDNRGQASKSRRRPEYLGPRSVRFAIAPGSALAAEAPAWVMAAELVETSRLWARVVTGIDPAWAEALAEHIATYSYNEPWWDPDRGAALVKERVTLYGLTLAANRSVQLGTVDRSLARELFIHHALVEGEWEAPHHRFLAHNRELIETVEAMEARNRRRDLLVANRAIFDFYDARLPPGIVSAHHFDAWWRQHQPVEPHRLDLSLADLVNPEVEQADHASFPDTWHQGDLELELAYEFDPTSPLDGLSVLVPVEVLNQLDPAPFQWSVPGFRAELVNALVRSLPKATRKAFVPVAGTTAGILPALDPERGPLLAVLAHELGQRAGMVISPDTFDLARVPAHLQPTFRVINDRYELLAEGKDVAALRRRLADDMRLAITELASADNQWERSGLHRWDIGRLPRVIETGPVKAYPALVDEGDSVAVRLLATEAEQADAMWLGVRRLLRLNLGSPVRQLDALIPQATKLQLVNAHVQSRSEWYSDAIAAALDDLIAEHGGPPWAQAGFDELVALARRELPGRLEQVAGAVTEMLAALDEIHVKLDRLRAATYQTSSDDIRAHLARLAYPGVLTGVGLARLDDVVRYLRALSLRLDALVRSPQRDLDALVTCRRLDNELAALVNRQPWSDELEELTWMLEELRVSLFAQSLGTAARVSEKRIRRALNQLRTPSLV